MQSPFPINRMLFISVVVLVAVALAGCGGGSSKMASRPEPPTQPTPPTGGDTAQPTIVQSSGMTDVMSRDDFSVAVEYEQNQITYSVTNGSEWSISDKDTVIDRSSTTVNGRDWNIIELRKDIAGGRLWVDVYSDIEALTGTTPDTDYLSLGLWLYVPNGGNQYC